jgi:hypothetical protein
MNGTTTRRTTAVSSISNGIRPFDYQGYYQVASAFPAETSAFPNRADITLRAASRQGNALPSTTSGSVFTTVSPSVTPINQVASAETITALAPSTLEGIRQPIQRATPLFQPTDFKRSPVEQPRIVPPLRTVPNPLFGPQSQLTRQGALQLAAVVDIVVVPLPFVVLVALEQLAL